MVRRPPQHGLKRAAIVALALGWAVGIAAIATTTVHAQEWQFERVDDGTKPALTLTSEGDPAIVYMLESQEGWVRVAQRGSDGWQVDQVVDGYFYGPPDIAAGPDGVIHAAYHDHQDSQFKPDKGDAVHLRGQGDDWTLTTAHDQGHDGWDNRITVDAEGSPHMAGVDPEDFGSSDGVEYYSLDEAGVWQTEPVGSGPQTYRWAVGVAVGPDGTPWVSYYDGASSTLKVSGRSADGWGVETVDDTLDSGLYSEITVDADGGQHISYFASDGGVQTSDFVTSGTVRYAYRPDPAAAWQISEIDELGSVRIGFTGARNITSIAIDADATTWVAYSDEEVMKLAHLTDAGWQVETVLEATDVPLGQIVSLEIDAAGNPHLAYADVTSTAPLDGGIWYATRA